MTWFITGKQEYLAAQKALAAAYREIMGSNYPSMPVLFVAGLLEDDARVEIAATAVLPTVTVAPRSP